MSGTLLDSFMQLKNIDPNFINASGEPAIVSDENVKSIVKHLGVDTDDEALLLHYQEEETRHWLSLLAPISVFQQSASYDLEVHLPIDFATDQLLYRVTTEKGLKIDTLLTATDFPLLAVNEISDVEFQLYNVTLPIELEYGYHQLALLEVGNEEPLAVMHLTITPDSCYQAKQIQNNKKVVSTNISLANLTGNENYLNEDAKLRILPEQCHNLFHLDLSVIAEFKQCNAAQDVFNTMSEITDNNAIEIIKIKLTALRYLFDDFNKLRKTNAVDELSIFITDGGVQLKQHVIYDALYYLFLLENGSSDYSLWPADFQSYSSQETQSWINENEQEILFWNYCHWVIEQQLVTLDTFIKAQGSALGRYKQMMIGASKNSLEMWTKGDNYCQSINIETPLDCPALMNVNRAYSPLIPDQLYKSGYEAFVTLLKSNMKHTGVLHIQHIVALLRLWWVPENGSREKGVFVYYNVYDMLNLLALESIRNQCVVVSDDAEILPDGMTELLDEMGVYPLSLFDFI